jgi:hypothetical protein
MPRKNTPERQAEINERDELERLLNQDTTEISKIVNVAESILPERPTIGHMNYLEVKEGIDIESERIVDSIAEFYLDRKIISEISYVREKTIVDKITVSNLLFQMKTAEHAIIKLLEEIDNGNTHPRTFEVLSSLQRAKMEIVKHMAQFMVIMENNYKNLKEDYRIKKSEQPQELTEGQYDIEENSNQVRGTKKLLETLRQAIPEHRAEGAIQKDKIEDVE